MFSFIAKHNTHDGDRFSTMKAPQSLMPSLHEAKGKRGSAASSSGVRAQTLRATNLSLALKNILKNPGSTSRSSIAGTTGTTRATASRLVDELVSANIVEEFEPTAEYGRGRPPVFLAPKPLTVLALGLEVSVSYLSARLIDLTGETISEKMVFDDFADSNPPEVMTRLSKLARQVMPKNLSDAIFVGSGLAIPGIVSKTHLHIAPNLGWHNLSQAELLAPLAEFNVQVVRNEADLGAYAVAMPKPGVPDGPASFIYVSGEVGIGGGIIINHQSLPGTHGWSGEIGHISTDPNGPSCRCGSNGCLEAYIGQRSLLERSRLPKTASYEDLLLAAKDAKSPAHQALKEGGLALGRALATVINLLDIPTVVIGGSVAKIAPVLKPIALDEMKIRVLQSKWLQPEIIIADESSQFATQGAAHMVLQKLVENPLYWTHSRL